jgi:hypothetical protein
MVQASAPATSILHEGNRFMKAITVEPLRPGTARFEEVPEPDIRDLSVLVIPS